MRGSMNARSFGKVAVLVAGAALLGSAMQSTLGQSEAMRERLHQSIVVSSSGQLEIVAIESTPLDAIYEVELSTGEVLYVNSTGEYLFAGDLYQTTPDGLLNLSAATRQEANLRKIAAVPDAEAIVFEPEGEVKATLTVFTDVDCTYCRQLHSERGELLELGVRIRYLAYPRGGENAESYDKMLSVWCSDDRHRSLTQAKNGQNLPARECDSPVLAHYDLGNQLGIQGTPALVFPDGRLIPGYLEAPRLAAMLGIE